MKGQEKCLFCGDIDFHPYMVERVWTPDNPIGWICEKCFKKLSLKTSDKRTEEKTP